MCDSYRDEWLRYKRKHNKDDALIAPFAAASADHDSARPINSLLRALRSRLFLGVA